MDKPLRALIIEDSEDDTLLLVRELKRGGFDVTYQRVETAKGMKEALTKSWDIVFSDHRMPHFNSFEALKILKESGVDIPFIIISGVIGEEVAVAAMKAGAHDYLMKGHLDKLVPVIERAQQETKLRKENQIAQAALQESEEKYRTLIEMSPYAIAAHSEGKIVFVNPSAMRLMGAKFQNQLINKPVIEVVHPEYRDMVKARILRMLKSGKPEPASEQKFVRLDGLVVDVEVSAKPFIYHNRPAVMVVANDITDRKRQEDALHRRDMILDAVAFAAERFLQSIDWESSIKEILSRLGKAAQVSRVYIFEKQMAPNGRLLTTQRYEWVAKGITSQIDNPLMQNLDVMTAGFGRWVKTLTKGQVLYGNIRDFPANERKILSAQNILSIVIVPIFSEQTLWGFIGFDECLVEREWTRIELDTLKAAASIIGSAIQRKQIEKILHDSEEKYRTMFDLADDAILILDFSGNLISANLKAFELSGLSEKVIGHNITEFGILPPASLATIQKNLELRLAGKKLKPYEVEIHPKHGKPKIVEISASLLRDAKGTVIGDMAIIRDITEWKLAVNALKQSEEKYRSLVQNVNIGVYRNTPGPQGKFIEVNPAMCRIFGYSSPEELKNITVSSLYQNSQERKTFLKQIVENNLVKDFELRLKKKDCIPIIASLTASAHRDIKGKIDWIDGVIEDITKRKRAEEAIRQSEERYRTIFETANDAICIFDHTGIAISGNQRLFDLTGLSEKDLGSHVSQYPIFPRNSLKIIREKMATRYTEKEVGPYEIELHPINGTPKTVEINATLLRNPNGEVWGDLAIIRDITERKQYENALQQAKEIAESANKAKTSFLHNMSHELRSPMTSILGFTDLLIDKEENSEKKEMLEIVNNSSGHLLKIINDLLDLSRIEAGKMILEKIKCNIFDAVQKTYKSFEPLAKQKGIDFILNINKNLPEFIMTDYTKIIQIISNLLDNAFKFTERGKIELYIGLKTPVKPNENIFEFYINDTGIGIADEHKEQIFEKFVQGEHYISKKYGGAGLGLPIVKELVELMQGKISVKSKLAKGTKFTVQIPIEIK